MMMVYIQVVYGKSNFYNEISSTTLSDKGTTFTSNYYHGSWYM